MNTITFNQLPEAVQEGNEAVHQANRSLEEIKELLINHFFSNTIQRDKPYTLPEAASYCRMPIPTFRLHLSKRNVSGSKPGKIWIFRQEDLDKFLQKFHHTTNDEIKEGVDKTLRAQRRREKKETTIEGGAR